MRVFMLFHSWLGDGIVPQTTYQEDSTDGVCLLINTPKQKQEINLWVYKGLSLLPFHDRKEPTKNGFLVNFWIELKWYSCFFYNLPLSTKSLKYFLWFFCQGGLVFLGSSNRDPWFVCPDVSDWFIDGWKGLTSWQRYGCTCQVSSKKYSPVPKQ